MDKAETSPAIHQSRFGFIPVLVLAVTCAVLLVINHKLQKQNIVLVEQYRALSTTQGPPVGSRIPLLHGTSVSGESVTMDLTQRDAGTLLLILSPKCPHCKANFHHWQDLLPLVPANQVVWVDVTNTADQAYLASVAIPSGASVIRLDTQDRSLYNVAATPTTIWLDPHGVVKHVWTGELQDDEIKQIRQTLGSPNA